MLRWWLRLPSYIVNGAEVALGIAAVQIVFGALAGFHAAQLASIGAVCTSLADVPNTPSRAWRQLLVAAVLACVAAFAVLALRPWPVALGFAIAALSGLAMMSMAWGPRAGPVAFAAVLALVFAMALPRGQEPASRLAAWIAFGALAYLGWALLATALLQRRYRTLALVAALDASAQLLRSRAAVLAPRDDAALAPSLRESVGAEAQLAERLQSARDLLFVAPGTPLARRRIAILLRTIELRDVLLASRLDAATLADDAAARELRERVAASLGRIAAALDDAKDALRDGRAPLAAPPCSDTAGLPLSVADRLRGLDDGVARIQALARGGDEALPLTHAQLRLFVAPEAWPLSALAAHRSGASPVLRHAVRVALALGAAYFIAGALPWTSHPHWLVLSVAVVLRGNLEQTLARRNARVLGTMLGCLLVLLLGGLLSAHWQALVFLAAAGIAHAFVMVRYLLTATAATVMALLQSHLVDPAAGFAVAERLADTLFGALLAWGFSYVLPSWERRTLPGALTRSLEALRHYAQHTLTAGAELAVEQRLARRRAYDALGALAAAVQRSGAEPKQVQLPPREALALLDHAHRLMAHLSMLRLMRAQASDELRGAPVVAALRAVDDALQEALAWPARAQAGADAAPLLAALESPPASRLPRRLQVTLQDGEAVARCASALLAALGR
jgi:uncharacterized membrane protein YccC